MGSLDDLTAQVDAAERLLVRYPQRYLDAQQTLQLAVQAVSSVEAESLLPWAREALARLSKQTVDDDSLDPMLHAASLTVQVLFRRVLEARETTVEGVKDPTNHILKKFATPALPELHSLKDFLTMKPEGLSFPLSPLRYTAIEPHDCHGMFSKGRQDAYCYSLETLLGYSIFRPPEVGLTEFSYIPFWNLLIHESIKMYLQTTVRFSFDRNTNYETQTLSQLPDYVGYVGMLYSLLRGEEKAPKGAGDPRKELVEKLVWVYRSLPYLLGYYARGEAVTFGALYHEGGNVQFRDMITLDLSSITGRVTCQLVLFNMGRVLAGLCELCSRSNEISDTLTVQEADPEKGGKSVVLSGYSVIKGYMDVERAKKVWDAYSRIQGCPNAEKCHTKTRPSKRKRQSDEAHLYTLTFTPRVDTSQRARPLSELLRALLHVSNALSYAHAHRVMHRDVSWRNVGLDVTTNQWVLLDWDESCIAPAPTAAALCCPCHAPETSLEAHGTAVDVWGLGWLINSSKVVPLSDELEQLCRDCMEKEPKARPTMASCKKRLQKMLDDLERASKVTLHPATSAVSSTFVTKECAICDLEEDCGRGEQLFVVSSHKSTKMSE